MVILGMNFRFSLCPALIYKYKDTLIFFENKL